MCHRRCARLVGGRLFCSPTRKLSLVGLQSVDVAEMIFEHDERLGYLERERCAFADAVLLAAEHMYLS